MKTNRMTSKLLALFLILLLPLFIASAQVTEDALRFSSLGVGVGTRALGMGGAYIGVADDYSAVFWNPAGLAQMRRLEFTGGIINSSYKNDAKFFDATTNGKNSGTALDNLGFVFPFPTVQGSLVFAVGYNRVNDFITALSFNGFNSQSSILPLLYDSDVKFDIPFWVGLEDTLGRINVKKNVNQQGEVREEGSIGNWSFAGAIDVEKNLSFGLTINVINGMYTYVRNYVEEDTKNNYSDTRLTVPIDDAYLKFKKFYYDSNVSSEITGANAKFGMMYRYEDIARIGVTIKTPSAITIHETYTDEGTSEFDDGFVPTFKGKTYTHHLNDSYNDYGVLSPWVFGAGGSYLPIEGLLLAADVEYTDWTQIKWANNSDLEKENITMKKNFRSTMNIRVGGEFEIPKTDFRVRAGYILKPSAFDGDPSSYDQKIITAGAGVLLQNNVMFDVAAAFGTSKTFHNNYGSKSLNLSRTDEKISTTNVNFSISYRF